MKVQVKICGIRNLESALVAIDVGADFLGFNFVKTSKRYINPISAKDIIDRIKSKNHSIRKSQDKKSNIKIVGVFQNAKFDEVNKIADELNLDFVQLHGKEDEKYMSDIKHPIIKKINHELEVINYAKTDLQHFLIDRKKQGEGEMVDLEMAKNIAKKYQIFFSGGLTPENILDVIRKVKPFAVDVASGVETNGEQDLEKIKLFIKNAKGAIV